MKCQHGGECRNNRRNADRRVLDIGFFDVIILRINCTAQTQSKRIGLRFPNKKSCWGKMPHFHKKRVIIL